MIGPALNWGEIHWKQNPLESSSSDTTNLRIQLFDEAGIFGASIDTLFTLHDSIINLSGLVNAGEFPYMKLTAKYSDLNTQTPAQMDFWHVLYSPIPEAAIDASSGTLGCRDRLFQEGETEAAVDVVIVTLIWTHFVNYILMKPTGSYNKSSLIGFFEKLKY